MVISLLPLIGNFIAIQQINGSSESPTDCKVVVVLFSGSLIDAFGDK